MSANENSAGRPAPFDRTQMLQMIKERMPQNHQTAIDVMSRVNSKYVETDRDENLSGIFNKYLSWLIADQRYGRVGKGEAFYITGDSGSGKTDAVEHLLKTNPTMAPISGPHGAFPPYLSVKLQGPATLRAVGSTLLREAGYSAKRDSRQNVIWETLAADLVARNVLIVHIDEPQHLIETKNDVMPVANALKSLVNHVPPIGLILSGLPETNIILANDEQSERRQFSYDFTALDMRSERFVVEKIVSELCKEANLKCDVFLTTDMPERLAHAANYQFGRVCEVLLTGIQIAVLKGDTELTGYHLERAYRDHSHTRGRDDKNPFLTDGWNKLAPGYFIVRKEKARG
jgi:hypothetical protein